MELDPEVTHSLVKDGFCVSLTQAKNVQVLADDTEALEKWKRKQKGTRTLIKTADGKLIDPRISDEEYKKRYVK